MKLNNKMRQLGNNKREKTQRKNHKKKLEDAPNNTKIISYFQKKTVEIDNTKPDSTRTMKTNQITPIKTIKTINYRNENKKNQHQKIKETRRIEKRQLKLAEEQTKKVRINE